MALRLEVPITVEVAGATSAADLTRIERACGDAALTALTKLRDEYVAPRGSGRTVVVHPPTVDIHGTADDRVERAVAAGLAYATAASGIVQRGGEVSPQRAGGEAVDARRRTRRGYRVPVFDDGSDVEMPVEEPEPFTHSSALERAWRGHLERFGPTWDPARFGYPGYYGSYLENGASVHNSLTYFSNVAAIDEDGWPTDYRWQTGALFMLSYDEENDKIGTAAVDPAMGHWVLTRTEEPATAENLVRLVQTIPVREGDPMDPAVQVRMAAEAADPNGLVYTLTDGDRTRFMSVVPGSESTGGIAHSPIRFIADQADLGGGAGGAGGNGEEGADGTGGKGGAVQGRPGTGDGAGGGGRRPRGGPLGTAVGEGSVWPTAGIGGESLVCQPFLGEPPVTQLASGGDLLDRNIRALASQLDVDPCGYAGQFVLNAAKLIGARAHAVGVTSANSSTTTTVTVHPAGDGNNGYVNVEAGEAAELQYMRLLGDLATDVVSLANLVTTVYLLPENRNLIYWDADHDFGPGAPAWTLRFWREIEITKSCMWLFAETCRVILLQQLRSSKIGIEGRQQRFEEFLSTFTQKLDILGSSVVKMSVLKRAVKHADAYGLTGSVRSVLEYEPPPVYLGDGDSYQPPAPIESVAASIVTLLADATITDNGVHKVANYSERTWTADELDQAIGIRRGMLNMTDPVFLQVADLDSLYTNHQRDNAWARTYLTNLLAEMLSANSQMIRSASAQEKGAFFALEASQYVKAKGGVNSRGLHYDLQGIHDLADKVLAPHCGSLHAYTQGVDLAIGVKAGWDDFIAVFSTVGIIALALLCAPLGAAAVAVATGVAGIALTVNDVLEADRMEALYRSLEDPEAILHWQDVELQRLMANLSIAFSIFDVVGVGKGAKAIVAGVKTALKEVAEVGLKGAARSAIRSSYEAVLRNMAGEVMQNAVKEAMQATVLLGVATALLPVVVTPVLVPWVKQVATEHGTLPEVEAILRALPEGGQGVAP